MFTVREAVRSGKREVVIVESQGRLVGGGSLNFVQWLHERVPCHQLSAEQVALVKWYEDNRLHDGGDPGPFSARKAGKPQLERFIDLHCRRAGRISRHDRHL